MSKIIEPIDDIRVFIDKNCGLEMAATKNATREQLDRIVDNYFANRVDQIVKMVVDERNGNI